MDTSLEEQLSSYGKKKSKNKYVWFVFFLTIVIIGGGVFLKFNKESSSSGSGDLNFVTQEIKKGSLEVSVMATGNLEPTNSLDIGIEVSGTIKEIYVDYNDEVKVGQLLAKLDTTKLKAQVDSSKASLAIAKANLKASHVSVKSAKAVYERTKKMYEKSGGKYPSINDLDDAMFAYENAEASYEAKKAQVMQSEFDLATDEDNLRKAIVKSSINGVVLDRVVEIGQTVNASNSTPTLFTVAKDLSKMELIVSIDEADVANIKEGLNVTFTVDAYQSEIFKGKIKQVRLNPISESGVVTYETVVSVENDKLLLRPGMTASAKIITSELIDVMLIPNAALRFKLTSKNEAKKERKGLAFATNGPRGPRGNKPKEAKDISRTSFKNIFILENSNTKRVRVRILETDGKFTAIESKDISSGDIVIISQRSANE